MLFKRPFIPVLLAGLALPVAHFALTNLSTSAIAAEGAFYTIKFPARGKIGEIGIVPPGASYEQEHGPRQFLSHANGTVRVPKGAQLSIDFNDYMGLEKPLDILGAVPADALTALNLSSNIFPDKELGRLAKFTNLHRLELSATETTDGALQKLSSLAQLEALKVDRTKTRGQFLADFAPHGKLKLLCIQNNDIDKKYLAELKHYPHLHYLRASKIKLRDSDIAMIAASPEIEDLNLAANADLTDGCLGELKKLTKLKHLQIDGTKITLKGLVALKDLHVDSIRVDTQQGPKDKIKAIKTVLPGVNFQIDTTKEKSYGMYKDMFE